MQDEQQSGHSLVADMQSRITMASSAIGKRQNIMVKGVGKPFWLVHRCLLFCARMNAAAIAPVNE
jgi:hypothetical protein